MIKAWWYKGDGNNFGDVICPTIIEGISSEKVSFSEEERVLVSIGSVAFYKFNKPMSFWGSGAIDLKQTTRFIKQNKYHAVRGPMTRDRIIKTGGDCPEIYGDPSMLLPILFPKNNIRNLSHSEISILPHWVDLDVVKGYDNSQDNSIKIIDIRSEAMKVLSEIASSNILLTSSLHGVIVGEAYDIPTLFVEFGTRLYGGKFKFYDYFSSTNRSLSFYDHKGKDKLELSNCLKMLNKVEKPKIDLKKFINSYPLQIKNKQILEFLNG